MKGRGGVDAAYIMVPEGLEGKSMAKAIEARAIQQLEEAGFPLLSSRDSRNRNTPRRSAPAAGAAVPAVPEGDNADSPRRDPGEEVSDSFEASFAQA